MVGGLNSKNYYEVYEKNNWNLGNINMIKN